MSFRPRTKLVLSRKARRCPKCRALIRRRMRCKRCHQKQNKV